MRRPQLYLILSLVLLATGAGAATAQEVPTWPMQLQAGDATAVLHAPQLDSWKDRKQLSIRMAVELTPAAGGDPTIGALWLEAQTKVNVDDRVVDLTGITLTRSNFPGLDPAATSQAEDQIAAVLPRERLAVPLDRILAALEVTESQAREVDLQSDPPEIIVRTKPAVLVMIDGDPIMSQIPGTGLMYVVNTNWDLIFQIESRTYFLRDDSTWLQTQDLAGAWTQVEQLPQDLWKLPSDANWQEVRQHLPGKKIDDADLPEVIVRHAPAELVVLDGAPQFTPIKGTGLLRVVNTDAIAFLCSTDGHYYYLVSGRWFRATAADRTWESAQGKLPADFKKLTEDQVEPEVLAAIPGSREAQEAAIVADIPHTAKVNKEEAARSAAVSYQGDPQFEPIVGTTLEYAVNTSCDVIKDGATYYLCLDGVWFSSSSAEGPWTVCTDIPDEIYAQPASSPVYHTTYVYAYDDDDDDDAWVLFGYTAGYLGSYLLHGCLVYGTGYYYPPYAYQGCYLPRWGTYGYAARYNPYTGTFARGAAHYGPYGGYGRGAAYNPSTGTYARGAAAWGPGGGVWAAEAYNPRTNTYAATSQHRNAYASWGQSVVQRGDDWVHTAHKGTARGGVAGFESSEGGRGVHTRTRQGSSTVARSGSGDLYVGHNGNVYRKGDDGWARYQGSGDWNTVEHSRPGTRPETRPETRPGTRPETRPTTRPATRSPVEGLNRDAQARQRGAQRTRDYSSYRQQSRTSRFSSSSRPSHQRRSSSSRRSFGGGRRGGGRRR
jgi:hypothetical protein